MNKALSDTDILNMIGGKANLFTYQELQHIKTLDEALGKYKAFVLLYEARDNFGHWTCVFKTDDQTVEVFDPYGVKIDEELKWIPDNFRKVNYLPYAHLSYLLWDSGYNIIYNDHKLQKHGNSINTCGRWVVCRLNNRNVELNDFAEQFEKYNDPDEVVVRVTGN